MVVDIRCKPVYFEASFSKDSFTLILAQSNKIGDHDLSPCKSDNSDKTNKSVWRRRYQSNLFQKNDTELEHSGGACL